MFFFVGALSLFWVPTRGTPTIFIQHSMFISCFFLLLPLCLYLFLPSASPFPYPFSLLATFTGIIKLFIRHKKSLSLPTREKKGFLFYILSAGLKYFVIVHGMLKLEIWPSTRKLVSSLPNFNFLISSFKP